MAETVTDRQPALNAAFPSIFLMGGILVFVLALIFICSWKLILLEQEREEVAQDRLLLQRDQDAFLTYGSELPQMREQHRKMEEELARQEARQKLLEKTNNSLEERREALNLEVSGLSGAVANLQAQVQGLNAELGQSSAELRKIRPQLAQGNKELALLRAQEGALRESIQARQKTEAALVAGLAGLERARAQAEEQVKRLNADKVFFEESQKKHDQLIAAFENLLARSGALTDEYAARMEDLSRTQTSLASGQAAFEADLKSLAGHLDGIRQARALHAALLKTAGEQTRALQQQVDGVSSSNRKFGMALESVQGLDRKVQAALAAEVKTLAKWAGEDAETRAKLAAATQTLGHSVESFRAGQETARAHAAEMAQLSAAQKEELQKLNDMAAEFALHAEKSKETSLAGLKSGASLQEVAQALQKQADQLQARLNAAELQGGQMEKLMDGERERLGDLSRLARETREGISRNNHLGEEVRAALAEILALLRKPDASSTSQQAQVKHD